MEKIPIRYYRIYYWTISSMKTQIEWDSPNMAFLPIQNTNSSVWHTCIFYFLLININETHNSNVYCNISLLLARSGASSLGNSPENSRRKLSVNRFICKIKFGCSFNTDTWPVLTIIACIAPIIPHLNRVLSMNNTVNILYSGVYCWTNSILL